MASGLPHFRGILRYQARFLQYGHISYENARPFSLTLDSPLLRMPGFMQEEGFISFSTIRLLATKIKPNIRDMPYGNRENDIADYFAPHAYSAPAFRLPYSAGDDHLVYRSIGGIYFMGLFYFMLTFIFCRISGSITLSSLPSGNGK